MRITASPILLLLILITRVESFALPELDSIALSNKAAQAYRLFLAKPDTSINIAREIAIAGMAAHNTYFEGYGYFIQAKAYWTKGNYRLSTEFGFKALELFENTRHTLLWGETLLSLARTFIDLKNYDQARRFLDLASGLANTQKNERLLADVFRERSMLLLELRQYDSALYWSDKGIAMYQEFLDTLNMSILYGRKARVYTQIGDFETSIKYNKKAIELDSLVGNRRALGIAYYQAALNEYNLKHADRSVELLKKSISLVKEIGTFNTLIRAHGLLAEIYSSQGKTDLAFQQMKITSQFKDSLYNTEKSGQIQEMQSLYELGKKEAMIQSLEKEKKNQRYFAIFLLVGIVLLLLLISVLYRLRIIQAKTNAALEAKNIAIEQQREEMQTQAENLHQLNQLKSKLFSVISHDLRGPIGNLQALLELLTSKAMSTDEFMFISYKLKSNLNVTQRTLENLLSWSLSQMEGLKTVQNQFDIRYIIDDACNLMEEIAQRKNITFEKFSETSIPVMADHNQIQLILRNLIHNAIKFSREDSRVLVRAEPSSTYCRISVQDFGIGMTPVETDMILGKEEFFSRTGTNQEKGTGLGLLLCKEFIKRNGGSLSIESAPGVGTSVSFTVPLAN